MKVRDIDFGKVKTTPLKALYALPASVKCIPPQAKYAKLAGIRKKEGMKSYPALASHVLINAKKSKQVKKSSRFFSLLLFVYFVPLALALFSM